MENIYEEGFATVNHDEIKLWVEKQGGFPAVIGNLEAGSAPLGLRFDFPGEKDEAFLSCARRTWRVSWDRFFDLFEQKKLAFIYENRVRIGDPTLAYRFIKRNNLG